MPNLETKGLDGMKKQKDTIASMLPVLEIEDWCRCTKEEIGANLAGFSMPLDSNADFVANGNTPTRNVETHRAEWCTALHARGLKILWRGTWSGIEGLYGFQHKVGANRFPAGDSSSRDNTTWLGKTYLFIYANALVGNIASGDQIAFMPERTEGIFNDNTAFLPNTGAGIQTNFENFFKSLRDVCDAALSDAGVTGVTTGMTAINYSEMASGWENQGLINYVNLNAFDYYLDYNDIGFSAKANDEDMRTRYAQRSSKPMYWQEYGPIETYGMSIEERMIRLKQHLRKVQALASEGKMPHYNSWTGWEGQDTSFMYKDAQGKYHANALGRCLAELYKTNSVKGRLPLVADVSTLS